MARCSATLLLAWHLGGCGASASAVDLAAPTGRASETASGVERSSPPAAPPDPPWSHAPPPMGLAEPAPRPADLPVCARRPARAPVGFAAASTPSGLIFTTTERGTEASLQRVQRLVDGFFGGQGDCYVSRSDGELLVVYCTSTYLNGSGNARTGPSESFIFHRVGLDWTRIDVRDALPGAGADPRPAFAKTCAGPGMRHFADLPLTDPGDGSSWLSGVEALPAVLSLETGKRGEPGGSITCNIPWPELGAELGCGPLAHLLRPELLDPAPLARAPRAPLAVTTGDRPTFSSRDPRTSGVAAALERDVELAHRAPRPEGAEAPTCLVTLSNADVISARCEGDASPFRIDPERAPLRVSLAYRLADGSRITSADLFGTRRDALDRVAAKCLGPWVTKPRYPGDDYLPSVPRLQPDDVAFALGQNDARFLVPRTILRHPDTAPQGITHEGCSLSYVELGFTWRDVARPTR